MASPVPVHVDKNGRMAQHMHFAHICVQLCALARSGNGDAIGSSPQPCICAVPPVYRICWVLHVKSQLSRILSVLAIWRGDPCPVELKYLYCARAFLGRGPYRGSVMT